VLKVPAGTQIFEEDNETPIADLARVGDRVRLAKGGNGGFGNAYFKSSTNRAPRHANPGQPGEERWVWLRLKLIADAGLLGLPNAGKSTLLAAVSAAKPKIADYPFTTLHPQLGVVRVGNQSFVLADIPGLIEGAHEGHGLGTRFLGHVERCAVLLHLIDVTAEDPVAAYRVIRKELKAYSPELAGKPEVIAFNKTDLLDADAIEDRVKDFRRRVRKTPLLISGATTRGVPEAMKKLLEVIDAGRRAGRPADAPGVTTEEWRP
jgi:GTP-binding protein